MPEVSRSWRERATALRSRFETRSRVINPPSIAPPAANYAHARLVAGTPATNWLFTSGVVAADDDGSVPDSIAEQAEVIWRNLVAMLDEASMRPDNIVSVTTYVVPGQDLAVVMAARDRVLGDHLAASTLVTVAELARPEWLMEISLVAAR